MTVQQHHTKIGITLSTIGVLTIAMFYTQFGTAQSIDQDIFQKPQIEVFPNWSGYEHLENMTSTSSDIVVGKVTRIIDEYYVTDVPVTKFEVTVEKSLKGKLSPGDKISQVQAADFDLTENRISNDVRMNVGEEYLLFLKTTSENTYYSIGGPQGRFLIKNSSVYSMDNIDSRAEWVHIKSVGTPYSVFENDVASKIQEVKQVE
jgi:hypothetical protein